MWENDNNYVIHVQESEDSPFVPKLLFWGGILYVAVIAFAIAHSAN